MNLLRLFSLLLLATTFGSSTSEPSQPPFTQLITQSIIQPTKIKNHRLPIDNRILTSNLILIQTALLEQTHSSTKPLTKSEEKQLSSPQETFNSNEEGHEIEEDNIVPSTSEWSVNDWSNSHSEEIIMRVKIAQANALTVTASEDFSLVYGNHSIDEFSLQPVMLQVAPIGVLINQEQIWEPVWVIPQTDVGLVAVNGNWYRGTLLIVPRNQQLLVINYVEIEDYLYSVVGAEIPSSWHPEALKAQAIAARSYAIAHQVRPADALYDLGNTEAFQVYRGIQSETSASYHAVQDTIGIVLMREGTFFEAMYAANQTVIERHHRGFLSMSQAGANLNAQIGLNSWQILQHYYPGTEPATFN
jgi:Stage II sporulation protein